MEKIVEAFGIVAMFLLVLVIVGLIVGCPIMWLWNAVVPGVFGLPTINFWQAVCLYLLSGMLIKSATASKQ